MAGGREGAQAMEMGPETVARAGAIVRAPGWRRLLAWGLGAGAVAGALDVALIAVADPGATGWVLAQSFLAWAAMGWAAVASESGLPSPGHGVAAALALDLPWMLALGPGAGHPEHLPPLLVMGLLFGAGFGWAHRRARA